MIFLPVLLDILYRLVGLGNAKAIRYGGGHYRLGFQSLQFFFWIDFLVGAMEGAICQVRKKIEVADGPAVMSPRSLPTALSALTPSYHG